MASPLLFPDAGPRLVGIARLAAHSDPVREGHQVEYFGLPARSLLNRCVSKREVPFTWTINPYRGCEFGCKYCYARYTHEFMEMRDGVAFEQKIYVKQHAAALLHQELKQVRPGESIAMGAATDPYQPAERHYQVSQGILEEFARQDGYELGMITKSDLVLRDLDLLQRVARRNEFFVHLTITTLNIPLARILEPRAPRPDLRMLAVRKLAEAGIAVGVSCSPVMPGINDSPKDLEAMVKATAEAGARSIFANPLFLKPCSAAVFLPFVEKEFPQLAANYRARYAEHAFLPKAYGKRIGELMHQFRAKYGLTRGRREIRKIEPEYLAKEEQMGLFSGA
jgi:DNA repair photolyase